MILFWMNCLDSIFSLFCCCFYNFYATKNKIPESFVSASWPSSSNNTEIPIVKTSSKDPLMESQGKGKEFLYASNLVFSCLSRPARDCNSGTNLTLSRGKNEILNENGQMSSPAI